MKISIIIPCYNEKDTIEKIIDKIIKEVKSDYEIIVIDDNSTDGSRELLKTNIKDKINLLLLNEKTMEKAIV